MGVIMRGAAGTAEVVVGGRGVLAMIARMSFMTASLH
jgi:hypothetical protein